MLKSKVSLSVFKLGVIGIDAHYRFSQLGISSSYCSDILFMNVTAANLTKDDVAVGISHSGKTKATVDAMRWAKKFGAKDIITASIIIELIVIPLAILISRLAAKDKYTRNIFTYGLSFSNFSFMGNAVVSALFPEIFMEYIIFTLVLWTFIYLWGVPALLMGSEHKNTIKERLKVFLNPMFISMAVGIMLGLNTIVIPASYGKDTRVASSMAIISHLFSCVTIPLIFMLI